MLSLEAEYELYVITMSPHRAHLSSVRTLISCKKIIIKKKAEIRAGLPGY